MTDHKPQFCPTAFTTVDGRTIDLYAPRAADISFAAVAEHLAKENRYNGATANVCYSVAQHSVHCAQAALAEGLGEQAAAYCLLHDAHEAYLKDDTTPKKRALARLAQEHFGVLGPVVEDTFKLLERRFDAAIHEAAGLAFPPPEAIAAAVHRIDRVLLVTEWRDFMPIAPPFDTEGVQPLPACLRAWHWTNAKWEFLYWCHKLLPALAGEHASSPLPVHGERSARASEPGEGHGSASDNRPSPRPSPRARGEGEERGSVMGDHSQIEWTDATWNPVVGCSVVSPGCTNCYAMRFAGRRLKHTEKYRGLTRASKAGPVWTGETRLWEPALTEPLRWRKPRKIFVCSEGDLFHESIPDEWIDRVFAVMALAPQHAFQVLTKRAARMRAYIEQMTRQEWWKARIYTDKRPERFPDWPLPNVWFGVSCEDQPRADERIPDLLATPAAVRFVSCEPLLGRIDLRSIPLPFEDANRRGSALVGHEVAGMVGNCVAWVPPLDWVIVGGESGRDARPMHPDWARALRDECAEAGVEFFFKQWGEWSPVVLTADDDGQLEAAYPMQGCSDPATHHSHLPAQFWQDGELVFWPRVRDTPAIGVRRVGRAAAGRLLDGREHNAFPEPWR